MSSIICGKPDAEYNLNLGRMLFSDPLRDRDNAVVVANHKDWVAEIEAGDLVRIDFTANEIIEGLYVVTIDDDFICYRFFQRRPKLHMRDDTGSYPVDAKMLARIKVVGRVKDIYRSTRHN